MLSFKDKIRPWKTMRLLVALCEARATIIKQLEELVAGQEKMLEQEATLSKIQAERIASQQSALAAATDSFDLQGWTSAARWVN